MIELSVGDILELKCFTYLEEQVGLNVHHFIVKGADAGATLEEFAAGLDLQLAPVMVPLLSDQAEYLGVQARRIFPGPPTAPVTANTQASVGQVGGTPLPKQTCGLISWRTVIGGPRGRGRTYVPFPGSNANDASSAPTATYFANLGDLRELLATQINLGAPFSNLQVRKQIWNPGGVLGEDVTSGIERGKWATQRRRSDFGATNERPF